jgi:DNA polymerase-3 subunit epsilon
MLSPAITTEALSIGTSGMSQPSQSDPILLEDVLFVITDVETTGLSAERNRITEVAAVHLRGGDIVQEFRTLVNPEQFIPPEIQKMTGISNAVAFNAEKGDVVYPGVREWFLEGAIFVAHNVGFDYEFLQASFRRFNVQPLDHAKLCTARLGRRLLPERRSWSLANLTARLGIRIRGHHQALGDAHATARVLMELLDIAAEEHHCETLADLLSLQYRTMGAFREISPQLRAMQESAAALSDRPGVYRMLDRRGETLYVGKAKSLRDRTASYFRSGALHTKKITEMVRRVRKIEVEETGSELGALLRESHLIKQLQPKYNTMQKRYRRYAFLRLDVHDRFPRVDYASEIESDGAEYFGPFTSRYSVESMIDTINHAFALRECAGSIVPNKDFVPCFYQQIGRCGAPCANMQSDEEYRSEVERVRRFLSGSETGIVALLEAKMVAAAERLEFEEAAMLRNRVDELRRLFQSQERLVNSVNYNNVAIILPAATGRDRELFLVRYGRLAAQIIVGSRTPVVRLRRLVESTWFDGAVAPSHCRKGEIDEIRIISGYLHQRRSEGVFLWVQGTEGVDDVLESITRELRPARLRGAVQEMTSEIIEG